MSEEYDEEIDIDEDTQHGRFLLFALENDLFGLEIQYVTEIIGIQPITEVPEVPDYVKGIINLRGKIIPVVDMRAKFEKERLDYNDRTCIIVIDIEDISIGLIVDNVAEVMAIKDEDIVPPPEYKSGIQNKYIKGIGKNGSTVQLLLDSEKLLREEGTDLLSVYN